MEDLQQSPPPQAQPDEIDWERVQKWVQTGIMFLMALYFIDLALPGGNLGNYINVQNFGWLTWVGAFILLAIAGINALDLLRDQSDQETHILPYDLYRDNSTGWATWLFLGSLAVPLVLGLGVASEPLGADAITKEISADVRTVGVGGTLDEAIAPQNRNLLDWIRAFGSSPDLAEFEGEPVNVIGFVYRDARFEGTESFMVVRFTLSCCVADASPLGLVVQGLEGQDFAQDTWVEVSGTFEVRNVDGVDTPVIIAESITETTQPEQPYLYF